MRRLISRHDRTITGEMSRFDFRTIVERLPLVVYVDELDEHSSPLYISPQIKRLLGYTPEEWLADPQLFVSRIHPDDRARVLGEIASRNRKGVAVPESDYRLVARDGRVIWVRDDELVVDGAAHGYLQDVTNHKRDGVRLELLVGILSLAADETPPGEIVAHAARRLAEIFGGNVQVTWAERRGEGGFSIRYTTDAGKPEFWDDDAWAAEYIRRLEVGDPIIVEDVTDAPWLDPIRDRLLERNVASFVDVPLLRHGELTGVLWFNSSKPRTWGETDASVLVDVAGQLAVVLANARAGEQRLRDERDLRRRDAILDAVSRSAERLVGVPLWSDAATHLLRALGEATAASRAYLFDVKRRADGRWVARQCFEWIERGAAGLPNPVPEALCLEEAGLARFADLSAHNEIYSGVVRTLPAEERAFFETQTIRSLVTVPVFVHGEWWGFIGFDDCVAERAWSAAETDALRTAASILAAAIERDRAERGLRRRDAVLEAVSHAAERLVAAPSWRDAAPLLLRELGEGTAASRAYLFETGRRADGRRVASQSFEWVAPGITPEIDNEVMQEMCFAEVGLARFEEACERNDLYAANVEDLDPAERELFQAQGIRALMTVPIFVRGEWWGFIGFDDCVAEREWSAAETDALRTAAGLVAAAVERERAEVVLREHEQKLRAVFETALDAIFITDDERRYVDVNAAACEYLGVSKRDLVGGRMDEFLPDHHLAALDADWAAYLASGPVVEEWEFKRSDGSIRIAEASARPNFLPGLHIAFLRDVTDRKRLERELLNAQKLESLGRLAGGVAHDFNNLLTGIGGYASLLLERANGDAALARDVGEIKRAAERASELTKQLLAFGRRQMFSPRPLDLNAVLADVSGLLQGLVGDEVELEVTAAPDLGIVRADPGQIEQVVVNLVVNARDALPRGGRITIETRNADEGSIELVVADDGLGMDEATRSQVFEPFFTTREQGVGLGLASVYGIVHQSGGSVAVASAPGEGAVFTVRLPRIADEPDVPAAPAVPESRPGSETVLLVEDEDIVRDLARRVLERSGYTVLACADGAAALAVAESHDGPIDLLLTDVVMPGLRGYEVAARVVETRPEIKVLYMSGYAEEAPVGNPKVRGGPLIEKPFAIDVLTRRVREELER
jgi:two-component system cell cycle sensor histidine kinase/response regulator CckA